MRQFDNVHNLSKTVVALRVRQFDSLAEVELYVVDDGESPLRRYVSVETTLTDVELTTLLSTPETPAEQSIVADYVSAVTQFNTLPNWAVWTVTETNDHIVSNILNGWNQAQADSWIDGNVTDLASARTALKQLAGAIISTRTILTFIAKMVVYIRNYVIKVRR